MRAPRSLLLGCVAILLATAAAPAHAQDPQPYAGQQHREIKALDPAEVDDLLAGRGMGFALAAELNGYPGPRHVLDLAAELELTEGQRTRAERVFAEMQRAARSLGARIVDAERVLDERFASREVEPGEVDAATAEIARLRGELRAVHLKAHLALADVLGEEQVRRYRRLRGYDGGHGGARHEHGGVR